LAWLLVPGTAVADPPTRFAIVVGNNRPERSDAEPLRYADDDAVAVHRLLVEAKVHSVLLTHFDDDTQRLANPLVPNAPPRRDALEAAFITLARAMSKVKEQGGRSEFLFYYSGHGDVEEGEGYAVFEDGRLTRRALHDLLARSPAARNHVFIDACKSYFLAFEKGAGGERLRYGQHFVQAAEPAQLANTGFILSTSSARDSHEWERYQGGILSHEIRSALRGAADLNHDGQMTYAELGAFVASANRTIDNPRFRPDVMVHPPGGKFDEVVFDWPASLEVVSIDARAIGHFYVETAHGDRVLDAHPQADHAVALHLPSARPLFIRQNDEKAELVLAEAGPAKIPGLQPTSPQIASRGALDVAFEQLFASSFGPSDLLMFTRARSDLVPPPQSLSDTRARTALGLTALVAGTATATLAVLALREYATSAGASQAEIASHNRTLVKLQIASLAGLAVAGASAIGWWLVPSKPGTRIAVAPAGASASALLTISGAF
jgi:hypothetical protein